MHINQLKCRSFYTLLTVAVFLFFYSSYAQQSEFNTLYKKASEDIFHEPSVINNILSYLKSNAKGSEQKSQVAVLYSDYYLSRGEYDKSLEYIFSAGENLESVSDSLKLEIILRKAQLVHSLKLHSQFEDYEEQANKIFKNHEENWLLKTKIQNEYEKAYVLIHRDSMAAAEKIIDNAFKLYTSARIKDNDLYAGYAILKALTNTGTNKAAQYLTTALENYKTDTGYNRLQKAAVMVLLSDCLRKDNRNEEAISLLTGAESETVLFENPYIESSIYERLSTYFTGYMTPAQQIQYNEKFVSAYTEIHDNEITALNSFYKLYKSEMETTYSAAESEKTMYYIVLAGLLFVVVITFYVLHIYKNLRVRKLTEIIGYLEVPNKLLEKKPVVLKSLSAKEKDKKINMPDDTERMILEKLKVFEQSGKFTNPNMSLALLAGETDVNTKYLSEVINNHYNDNYNTYINKLRVNYIIEKLKNDPNYLNYKISYLAEESGFSSHSSFTTVFRNIAGISPTEFIQVMSKQIQQKA
ncbi:helix-turn-helix domain-containing protein [Flavobacterium sp. RHBU_3]|uniref:helix-turn-helix domain-containing protein n=1 Tax=Flavobacterium sp. RHBU_3 TaxID=3391184 RepID=UPI0039856318